MLKLASSFYTLLVMVSLSLVVLTGCAPTSGLFANGIWQVTLQLRHIHSLVVDPNNTQNIYAGDSQDGIFVSKDAGLHWTQYDTGLPTPSSILALTFDVPGKKLFAATANGLFVSSDAAQNWTAVGSSSSLPTDSYTAFTVDYSSARTIYVGSAHHGVFASKGEDVSVWSSVGTGFPLNAVINALSYDADHHQLWAATSAGIYQLDTNTSIWQALNQGLPSDVIAYAVQPAYINGGPLGLIYAGTNHGFFSSDDTGAHWKASQNSLSGTNVRTLFVDFRASNAATLFVGTDVGVLRSDDSGQNWHGIAGGLPNNLPVYALTIGGSGNSQLYAANNSVYIFPGSSGGFDLTRLFPILAIIFLFYMLLRFTGRRRKSAREILKPERIIETPELPSAPFNTLEEKRRSNLGSPPTSTRDERKEKEAD